MVRHVLLTAALQSTALELSAFCCPYPDSWCAGFAVLLIAFRRGVEARGTGSISAGVQSIPGPSGSPPHGRTAPGYPEGAVPSGHADAASGPLSRLGLPLRLPFGLSRGVARVAPENAARSLRKEGAPAGSPVGETGAAYPQQPVAPTGAGGGVLWRQGGAETLEVPGAPQPVPGAPAGGSVLWRRDDAPAPAGGILWTRSDGPAAEEGPVRDNVAAAAGGIPWTRTEGFPEGAGSASAAVNGGGVGYNEEPLNGAPAPVGAGAAMSVVGAAGGADEANGWEDPWRAPYPNTGSSASAEGQHGAGAEQRGVGADSVSGAVALGDASAMEDLWRIPMGQGPLQSAEPQDAAAALSAGSGAAARAVGREAGSGIGSMRVASVQGPDPAERRASNGAPVRGTASRDRAAGPRDRAASPRDRAAAKHLLDRAALLDNFEA